MVSVRDRALIGKHDTVGRAYICLDPRRYGDFLTHDQWMDLDTQGRILLRVSMEGEKDDPQFYFGRAFRSLKRAEADMVRVFIDKVCSYYSHTFISPSFLHTVMFSCPHIKLNLKLYLPRDTPADLAIHPTKHLSPHSQVPGQTRQCEYRLQQGSRKRHGSLPFGTRREQL